MPLYDFQCETCGAVDERYAKMDEKTATCDCGSTQKRIITSRYYVNPDIEFLTDNITGDPIRVTSRKQLDALMKRHGLYQRYGKGWQ